MKITKLIIPLLGLTSINNANKQELLQLEKMPEISYEVSVVDNWDNYYYLTNANTTENSIQKNWVEFTQSSTKKNETRKPISYLGGCEQMCYEILRGCTLACLASFFPPACQAGCLIGFGICMAACS